MLTATDQLAIAKTHLRDAVQRLTDAHCHLFNATFDGGSQALADAAVDLADLSEQAQALSARLKQVRE
ncbi:hypothetical protein ACFSYH_05925 [Populibacterium corticicola]|uniref:Uncharacterized protein n=1 Tax=Populibacterium corticicola TaxID=1812826 RepID=A0ABW5XCQ8_9MICO